MLRPAIQADLLTFGTNFETELGSDHYFFTERSERFACEFFVRERTVHFSGIEKRHTLFKCRSNQRNHLLLVLGRTIAKAHSHAAQPNGRDFQVTLTKFALLHTEKSDFSAL